MRHRHLGNIMHAKYLELSAIHNPAVWMSFDWKYISDDLQPMREQDTGQREARGGLLFFYKAINVSPLQCAYIFLALETDQLGYMTMKQGLGFFLFFL